VPTGSQSWFQAGLRFCGSCTVTLACWALWLVLGALLAGLLYVSLAKELPVPDFILRRVEAELARADLGIKFGRAQLDPTGKILLENVQLRLAQFEEPLVTSRLVYLRRSFWSVLAGSPVPDEIRLEGAVLQLPAMLSPSGTAEPLIRDLALTLRHEDRLWQIAQLTCRVGRLTVTARGELTVPARPAGAAPLAYAEITRRFLQASRRIALEIHQLDAFEDPTLAVRLDSPDGVGNTATLLFTARSARAPWAQPLTLGPLAVGATMRLDGRAARPVRLHAAARHADWRDGTGTADNVRAVLTAQVEPENFTARLTEARVAASRVTADAEAAIGPVIRADLARWPEVRADVALQLGGEFLAAEVEARLAEQSARLRAAGRGAPEFISSVLTRHTPRAAPYFVFGDPVAFNAEMVFDPGWKFARLSARVNAGRIDSHGVKISAARGRIDIEGRSFLAHDARVELGENFATGSYWMDFGTTDYRMLLEGRLRPVEINGWFRGDWWLKFWADHFTFPGAPPGADVEVSGRWKEPARTVYFGRADTGPATALGGDFESAHTLIFLRPYFTHGLEISATRAGGTQRVDGTFKRFTDGTARETTRVEFTADSSLGTETFRKMAAGKAEALLTNLQFGAPPRVQAQGAIEGKWPGAQPNFSFTGRAEGGLTFYGFPLDTAQVAGGVSGADFRLDDIRFTAAGGTGAGKAALDGPADARRLGFDVHVNGADLARAIRAVEIYQANRAGVAPGPVSESKFMQRASGGRLDVALSALGAPGELASFTGNGNAALTGTELGEIHLFGLLSQVLSKLSLNFSSLKLDAARTSFRLEAARLVFPDLKITGPSAVIDAHGDYTFASNALDFTAKLKPFEENRNPLTAVLGIVITPITSILELKLNGPISKPNWSIIVGPSPTPPAPPAPVPAAANPTDSPAASGKADPPKN
jgi:hypothetical protein